MGKLAAAFLIFAALGPLPAAAQNQFTTLPIPTTPVSQLPAAGALTGPELFYVVQGGLSKNVTFSGMITSMASPLRPLLFGGGTPLTFTINPPVVAGAPQFIPSGVTTTALPALVVERSTSYSAGATTSPTLFVGTLVNVTNSAAFVNGIDSELELTANTGAGGGSIEAIRGRCVMDSGVANIGCWGGSFVVQALPGSGPNGGFGVESEVLQVFANAPVPGAIVIAGINSPYFASSGNGADSGKIIDAAFMVNPYSVDGFQAGFECPIENSAGTVVRYGCFVGAETATYGLDLSLGHWSGAAINATGFYVTGVGVASSTQILLSTAGNSYISATNANGGTGSNVNIQGFNGTINVTSLVAQAAGGVGMPNLPASAGGGGLVVCVDTSGNLYKKSSCP